MPSMADTDTRFATAPEGVEIANVPDFTVSREPIWFRLAGEYYAAPPILSGIQLKRAVDIMGQFGPAAADLGNLTDMTPERYREVLGMAASVARALVGGAHGRRIADRIMAGLDAQTDEQLDIAEAEGPPSVDLIKEFVPALMWLLERFGLRPTQQSSPFAAEPTTGDSTAGALVPALTGEISPLINS